MSLRPLLSSLLSPLLTPLIAPAKRILITLDSAQEGHYLLENPVVETGDFEWTFAIAPSDAAAFYGILGNTALGASDNVVALQPTTSAIRVKVGGVDQDFNSVIAPPSVLSACRITRVGTQMTVTIGLTSETKTVSTDTFTIDVIGVLGATLFFNGIIANPDLGSGNAWKLDRATGNTEQAANGNNELTLVNIPTGAPDRELFTKNTSTDPDQWENADKSRIIEIA